VCAFCEQKGLIVDSVTKLGLALWRPCILDIFLRLFDRDGWQDVAIEFHQTMCVLGDKSMIQNTSILGDRWTISFDLSRWVVTQSQVQAYQCPSASRILSAEIRNVSDIEANHHLWVYVTNNRDMTCMIASNEYTITRDLCSEVETTNTPIGRMVQNTVTWQHLTLGAKIAFTFW